MMPIPLFVCHANCCRSVLAHYLFDHLCAGGGALSAGVEVGDVINDRAERMLRNWGIDASCHQPRQLDRALCERADGIFAMGPPYLKRILDEYGWDLANKAYLFACPFTLPRSFRHGEYLVYDPSWDSRQVHELHREFGWMRERVTQIQQALRGEGRRLVPAADYRALLEAL